MPAVQTELFPNAKPIARKTAEKMRQHATNIQNGTWTVQNQVTEEHRTFKIETQHEDAEFAPKKRILSVMTGKDNENDFTNFAFISDDGERIFVWKKFRRKDRWTRFQYYADMLHVLMAGRESAVGKDREYQHYTCTGSAKCYRCDRKLSNPLSLELGIGPKCAGKM